MLPDTFTQTLDLILMFVVRIGIPIAITLLIGLWLERRLASPQESADNENSAPKSGHYTRTGNIIRIHCWDLKRCEQSQRAQCAAFQHPDLPCWLAIQADGGKLREDCFTCSLYKPEKIAA
jgi:hypothetical protein